MSEADPWEALGEGEEGGRFEERRKRRRKRRGGDAGGGGISIALSSATTTDAALVGDLIGNLGVLGGVGSYVFSFNSNPGGLFQIVGNQLQVAAALSAAVDPISIHADNGAGSSGDAPFAITVTHVGPPPSTNFVATYISSGAQ